MPNLNQKGVVHLFGYTTDDIDNDPNISGSGGGNIVRRVVGLVIPGTRSDMWTSYLKVGLSCQSKFRLYCFE